MKISMIAVDGIDQVTPLARELGEQGHHVTIHTRSEKPGKRRTTLAANVVVDPIPAGPERPLDGAEVLPHLAEFGTALAQRWSRKGQGPDVVHAHGWTSGLAAMTASRTLGADAVSPSASPEQLASGRRLPLLQTYGPQASHGARVDPAAQARLERALGRSAAASTVPCDENRDDLVRLGVPRTRIAVVPAGIDTEEFTERGPVAPRGERHRILVLTGPGESAHLAVRALTRLPGTELVIAGGPHAADLETDPDATELRTLAKDLGVDDRVIMLGELARKQAPRLIRSADLVLALHHDPYGTIALQAMACGVPVIAHDSGAHRDTVLDGVTGLLISDLSPVALARRVRDLLANPVRREALGIAAADRVTSRHSWDRIARETASLYDKIA
ncbi:glycosyltransferase [Actinocorallia longicatena]|uniref:Glycosyltransferase family 1 protein n=1 Tax=Actinocorallia longicatena TaxID=111803 RepID=A0ABP6QA58_9ACTN